VAERISVSAVMADSKPHGTHAQLKAR
jgi:hypothetical protein